MVPPPHRHKGNKRDRSVKNPYFYEYSYDEQEYWLSLPRADKQRIVDSEDAVTAVSNDDVPLRFRVLNAGFKPLQTKRLLDMVAQADQSDKSDRGKILEYLTFVCSLPTPVPRSVVLETDAARKKKHVANWISTVSTALDSQIYGQARSKRAVLRVVAQWMMNPGSKGLSIGLHGAYGCGKSAFGLTLSKAMKMPLSLIALGGISKAATLVGHDYTYIGAQPGAIARALTRAKSLEQIFLFDELDKVSRTEAGEEISNILVHLTDETQNERFHDKYVGDIELDLSRSLMIFTFNDIHNIHPVLLDRMTVITVDDYGIKDKMQIATKHLAPDALKAFALKEDPAAEIIKSEEFLRQAIVETAEEKGVRNLRRAIRAVCAEINLQMASGKMDCADNKCSTKKLLEILHAETAVTRKKSATHLSMYS